MNAEWVVWLCVILTVLIFAIEFLGIRKLKHSVVRKMAGESEENNSIHVGRRLG